MARSNYSVSSKPSESQTISSNADMSFFRRFSLSTRSDRSSRTAPNINRSPSTTKPKGDQTTTFDAPPAYNPYPPQSSQLPAVAPIQKTISTTEADSPFAFLAQFDTIFLIDDSGSMSGGRWRETADALSAISPIITEQDADGIDIYFLNHRNHSARNSLGGYSNVTSPASVREIFYNVRPSGATPTGNRLNAILKAYLKDLSEVFGKKDQDSRVKPLNVIVITDGEASDDVESTIVSAAQKLDKMGAEPWQVGIQFFQVGQDPCAAQDLQELDDGLASAHGIRDMVDTVPWNGTGVWALTAEGIMKVTMGAINRRLDRKRNSDDRLRHR